MTTIDIIKENIELILTEWVDNCISNLVAANPRLAAASVYIKRGAKSYILKHLDAVKDAIDKAAMFVLDGDSLDADSLYNDAMELFRAMPETQFDKGFVSGTVGQGVIRVVLPEGLLWSILFGDVRSIKITADDFASLRDLIKAVS